MGNDFCNSCNTQLVQDRETMYRTTSNSTYGSHHSSLRGYSVNPKATTIINQKPIGLENLTNTCYISAIFQILFLILPESINKKKGKITELFFKLKSTRDTKDYKIVKGQLDKLIEIVQGFQQQDAQQFLIYFLEILDRQNSDLTKKYVPNLDYNERLDLLQNYKIFISEMKKIESSPIVDLLSGQILNNFNCEKNHIKHKFQRYSCLSLSFPSPKISSSPYSYSSSYSETTLKQLILKYFQGQRISDLVCQQCKKKTNFQKMSYLYTLPNYLILHLSRFKQGYYSNQKINTTIQFDEEIAMSQQCDKSQLRYKLMGTVNHFGTLNRGHFYVQVKHTDGNWYQINDEVVRPTRIQRTGNKSKYVYILFYQRQK